MPEIVGIRFNPSGKIYYFETEDTSLQKDECVIVETNRGKDMGRVVLPPKEISRENATEPLKPVLRKATADDVKQYERQQTKNERALNKCRELVTKLNLLMKPISAHYNIDGTYVVIFFIAEKRVDFRELVKELSHELKSYVELRQVGARDEAKIVGGLGKCGQRLCCQSFLTEFSPVSIKMAKEQDIALNPMKTSGLCGRLLCCLGYEYQQYHEMKGKLPDMGAEIITKMGKAKIVGRNIMKGTVVAQLVSGVTVEVPVAEAVVVAPGAK